MKYERSKRLDKVKNSIKVILVLGAFVLTQFLVVAIVMGVLASARSDLFVSKVFSENTDFYNLYAKISSIVVMTVSLLFSAVVLIKRRIKTGVLPIKFITGERLLQIIVIATFCWILATEMDKFLISFQSSSSQSASLGIIGIISPVLIAPIAEEIIFRFFVIETIAEEKNDSTLAVILSGITFALMHGNIRQGVPAFIVGLVLATIYMKRRNLLEVILIHMIFNVSSILVANGLPRGVIAGTGLLAGCLLIAKNINKGETKL